MNPRQARFASKEAGWFPSKDAEQIGARGYKEQGASLLGARTLLGAPSLTTRSKKLLVTRGVRPSQDPNPLILREKDKNKADRTFSRSGHYG